MITHCPHCGKPISAISIDQPFTEKDIARFWASVTKQENGCWVFQRGGPVYGRLRMGGKVMMAHIASWKIHGGKIPVGHFLMHNCPSGDNPRCVNPDHLKTGTNSDNMRDMHRKGRGNPPTGTRNHMATLDEKKVFYIRESFADGVETMRSLAKKFNSSYQAINHVIHGKCWKSVSGRITPSNPHQFILTKKDILEIRRTPYYHGMTVELAKKYGVSQSHISKIINNDVWKNLKPK